MTVEQVLRWMEWVDSILMKLPASGRIRDKVLDTLFGPAEDFDYVSTTTPSGPPPSDS